MASLFQLSFFNPPISVYSSTLLRDHVNLSQTPILTNPTNHLPKLVRSENALQPFDEIPPSRPTPSNELHYTNYSEESRMGVGNYDNGFMSNHLLDTLRRSLIRALTFCTHEGKRILGQNYHALAIKMGFGDDKYLATSVLSMYARCGDVENAVEMFRQFPELDVVACNNLMLGYAKGGLSHQALNFFTEALGMGIWPTEYTFSIVLGVCGRLVAVEEGKQLHGQIVKMHYLENTVVGNALLTMYSKFGMMKEVEILFEEIPDKNVISWTAVMSGFYSQGCFLEALEKFYLMRHCEVEPNETTFVVALAACSGIKVSHYGRMVHAQALKSGVLSNAFVGTSIIDMYAEYGKMGDAERQFEEMGSAASTVSWNALLAGYVCNGQNEEALETFCGMKANGIMCDHFTYSNILTACSALPLLSTGEQLHCQAIKEQYISSTHVGSSLIEMYSKCGNLVDAESVFNQISIRDVVSWNTIIKAYSQHGYPEKTMSLFLRMIEEGTEPTSVTFLALLSACSHSGLVQEGLECLQTMVQDYSITPKEIHYSCIVDLLGRAGKLEDAKDFINNLPIEPTATIWRPLLAACRCHNDLKTAEFVAERILKTDPRDPTVYLTLSNMYAKVGRWDDIGEQRHQMSLHGAKKEAGCSWIELNNKLHKFYSRDTTHADTSKMYAKLEELVGEMKHMGYVPDTSFAIYPSKGISKEDQILHHSEKLAVCFGLINLPSPKPIRIFKNLRVCGDCHSAMKYISRITEREIVLRDNYRFHYFKQGQCSCGDFW